MFELIKGFPEQMMTAIEIGDKVKLQTKLASPVKNVVISGLGGSGIGGNLVSELLRDDLKVPVIVNKDYFLPGFVDSSSLIILCSYSGDTEETLSCAEQAAKKGLSAICITSGGKLAELAEKNKWDCIKIPSGFPPRTCLGYSATQLFYVLQHFGLIGNGFRDALIRSSSYLKVEQDKIMNAAEALAAKLVKKIIIVYAEDKYSSAALRLKQQINENSKMHCWYSLVPELNHNELVGWRENISNLAVIIFRSDDEFNRNTHRLLFKKGVIEKISNHLYELEAKGADTFERHFYLIHFGDWLSYHLAVLQGYDPTEIEVLNNLKGFLSSTK